MTNENNGIEINDYYMKEYAGRGWDDVDFVDNEPPSEEEPVILEEVARPFRMKMTIVILSAIAAFGAVIGLGYGVGYGLGGIGNREISSSNMNAVLMAERESIPTYSPSTYGPTSSPISEEDKLVAMFFPIFSNDLPIADDEIQDVGGDEPVRRLRTPLTVMAVSSSREEERVS